MGDHVVLVVEIPAPGDPTALTVSANSGISSNAGPAAEAARLFRSRPHAKVSALTVISTGRNGLPIKSLPPLAVPWSGPSKGYEREDRRLKKDAGGCLRVPNVNCFPLTAWCVP